jgi:hypothetical protein
MGSEQCFSRFLKMNAGTIFTYGHGGHLCAFSKHEQCAGERLCSLISCCATSPCDFGALRVFGLPDQAMCWVTLVRHQFDRRTGQQTDF